MIYEGTAVRNLKKSMACTEHGTVQAKVVVLATEAYTRTIEGHDRDMLPLANTVIATDPIPDSTWASIGLGNRELFEYVSNMLGYGQRTADNRIVWGGLSASYRWKMGNAPSPHFVPHVARRLQQRLVDLFPDLRGIGVTHRWGGVLGVPCYLLPGVGYDPTAGLAWGDRICPRCGRRQPLDLTNAARKLRMPMRLAGAVTRATATSTPARATSNPYTLTASPLTPASLNVPRGGGLAAND